MKTTEHNVYLHNAEAHSEIGIPAIKTEERASSGGDIISTPHGHRLSKRNGIWMLRM